MKRVVLSLVALLPSVLLVGCGSNPREALSNQAINQIGNAASKVDAIRVAIEDARKKTEADKTPNFEEAIKEVENLKTAGQEMKDLKNRADAMDKTPATDEEKRELAAKIKKRLNVELTRMYDARKSLNETIAAVEKDHKDALKTLRAKLAEVDGEFEAISKVAR